MPVNLLRVKYEHDYHLWREQTVILLTPGSLAELDVENLVDELASMSKRDQREILIGVVGAIVGQGNTYEEALSDVKSAIAGYIQVFGWEMLEDIPSIEVFIAEAGVAV